MIYNTNEFLPFMKDINNYSNKLSALTDKWDNAKLLCEMNCPVKSKSIVPQMQKIHNNFLELQDRLTKTLIEENLIKVRETNTADAKVAIDILMRNLFERTADVGFLATDSEIIEFIEGTSDITIEDMKSRLNKYIEKYSVYHDIIILDTDFKVLVNFDNDNDLINRYITESSSEEILDTGSAYVELFRETELLSGRKGHLFLGKIKNSNGIVVGIICLCFKFQNEMESIFNKILDQQSPSVITIIDNENKVIASSDENHIPLGVKMNPCTQDNEVIYYRGMKYMAITVDTSGYQGYFGLEWRAHILTPLHIAFEEKATKAIKTIDKDILSNLLEDSYYFSTELTDILNNTRDVNRMLRRFVYNGQLIDSSDVSSNEIEALKPLFRHIDKVGQLTKTYFDKSIKSLFATIISSSLNETAALSSLCIDIMDRNLYERANDCRWWALNNTFKEVLAQDDYSEQDISTVSNVLEYINSLYTVYKNLFIFDKGGKIIAVSNPSFSDNIGEVLRDNYVRNTLSNSDQQKYFVSSFKVTKQYRQKHTYIYSASITNKGQTVGGIGIVFDSENQFNTMLEESLHLKKNTFGVFVNSKGIIISSTNPSLKIGEKWEFFKNIDFTNKGNSFSTLVSYDGAYYSMGCTKSTGYREYKNMDNYSNEIYAFVLEKLSQSVDTKVNSYEDSLIDTSSIQIKEHQLLKNIAIFVVDGQYFAFDQSCVKDVIDNEIIKIPQTSEWTTGVVLYDGNIVLVVDSSKLLGRTQNLTQHLLIVKTDYDYVAMQIDGLNNVIEVPAEDIIKLNEHHSVSKHSLIEGIASIGSGEDRKNIIVLNSLSILEKVSKQILDNDLELCKDFIKNLDN